MIRWVYNNLLDKYVENLKLNTTTSIILDKNGIIQACNLNTFNLTGYTQKELKGKSVNIFLPISIHKRHDDYVNNSPFDKNMRSRIMGKKRPIYLISKDQKNIYIEITIDIIKIYKKQYLLALLSEINFQNQKVELIEYSKFFELSETMYCIISVDGYITKANDAFVNCLEYSEEELYSKPFFTFLHPEDVQNTLKDYQEIITELKPIEKCQNRYISKSGKILIFEWQGYVYDNKLICIVHNVTETYKKQNALLRSKMLNDSSEKLANFGCWKLDKTSNYLYFTDGLKNIYNWDKEIIYINFNTTEVIDYLNFLNFIHKDDINNFTLKIKNCLEYKNSFELVHKIQLKNKMVKYVKSSGKYTLDNNQECIIGISQDITENVRIEKELKEATILAEEAFKSKSIFLANMSHEIRTPINAIMGMGTLLTTTQLSEEQIEYNNLIIDSCGILLSLINNILNLSKIDAGKEEVSIVEFNIEDFINNLKYIYNPIVEKKKISFNIIIKDVPKFIRTDKVKFQQIIQNIINNAIKFTNEGYVEVKFEINTDKLIVTIKDTGIGISEENQKKLFKPFSQADSTTTKQFGGTGLGLAICLKLINLLNGTIIMDSELDKGTLITIKFPYLKTGDEKIEVVNHLSINKETCLVIVEDNKPNQIVLKKYLEKIGVVNEIVIYENGIECINKINNIDPVIIFMDLHMPKMNGIECSKKLRELCIKCPIITITANAMEGMKEKCIQAGMNDFIFKPYTFTSILEIIKKYKIKLS